MSMQAPDEDMPNLDEPPKSKVGGLLVVAMLVLVVVVVVGSVMMKKDSTSTIKREAEEFALRNNERTPTPPAEAKERRGPSPEPVEEKAAEVDAETQRRITEMAERMALAHQEDLREQSNKERAAAERRREEQRKAIEARRHSSIMISSKQASGTSPGGQGSEPSPALDAADPFARIMAAQAQAAEAQAAAAAGQGAGGGGAQNAPPQPFGFLPSVKAAQPETVAAGFFGDPGMRINQGKFLAAVLETAISSEQPGLVRAVVTLDVYSEDGSRVLVPAGSRITGEYRSSVQRGQSRVGIVWHRIARPDGVDVVISAPGTDALGVAGVTGDVDTHWWERFGASILLSLIDVYSSNDNSETTVVLASNAEDASQTALRNSINIPPTIYVDQGARINVFVHQDIDFSRVVVERRGL